MLGQSWNLIRKHLEEENIFNSLRGRIKYFATRYGKSHDNEGRVAILMDGKEVYKSCFFDWQEKRYEVWKEIDIAKGRPTSYFESGDEMELEVYNKGGFDQFAFYDAFYEYQNQSIDKSLISQNPIVRLFAIFDRRVGKRTLKNIALSIEQQPSWLQVFYKFRLKVESITSYVSKESDLYWHNTSKESFGVGRD